MPASNLKKIATKLAFKEWVTVQNAVELLTDQFEINITESDLYKAALDNQLILSLYLPEKIAVRFYCKDELSLSPASLDHEKNLLSEMIRDAIDNLSDKKLGKVQDNVEMVDGVWDIFVNGIAGNSLKHLYHESLNLENCDLSPGHQVLTRNGEYCEIQTFYENLFDSDKSNLIKKEIFQLQHKGRSLFESEKLRKAICRYKEVEHSAYSPACSLPEKSLLIIRKDELVQFVDNHLDIIENKNVMRSEEKKDNKERGSKEKNNSTEIEQLGGNIAEGINSKERKNMLVLIGILVDLLKTDSSNYNTQTLICRHVVNSYESCHGLSERTVNQRFAEANKLLEDLKLSIRTL